MILCFWKRTNAVGFHMLPATPPPRHCRWNTSKPVILHKAHNVQWSAWKYIKSVSDLTFPHKFTYWIARQCDTERISADLQLHVSDRFIEIYTHSQMYIPSTIIVQHWNIPVVYYSTLVLKRHSRCIDNKCWTEQVLCWSYVQCQLSGGSMSSLKNPENMPKCGTLILMSK